MHIPLAQSSSNKQTFPSPEHVPDRDSVGANNIVYNVIGIKNFFIQALLVFDENQKNRRMIVGGWRLETIL